MPSMRAEAARGSDISEPANETQDPERHERATWLPFMIAINVLLLGSLVALDRGAAAIASRPTEKRRIVLDVIHDDHAAMCADVAARLRTPVVGASVEEVDYVREVMVVVVEVETPRTPDAAAPAGHEPLDPPAGRALSWSTR
jgi:hypothetical protein